MKKQIDVTAAIIVKDKKVFAARRKAGMHLAGYWEFPGGKLEAAKLLSSVLLVNYKKNYKSLLGLVLLLAKVFMTMVLS
jgi:8-oxo-dGTP diphosphatase